MPRSGQAFLQTVPMLRILIPFTMGILFMNQFSISLIGLSIMGSLSLLGMMLYQGFTIHLKFRAPYFYGICFSVLLFSMGAIHWYLHQIQHHPKWLGKQLNSVQQIYLTLIRPLQEGKKVKKTIAKVNAVLINGHWVEAKGKILIYFFKDAQISQFSTGTCLLIKQQLTAIQSPTKDGRNYANYLMKQGIQHQVFLNKSHYQFISQEAESKFENFLTQIKQSILNILNQYISNRQAAGFAEALLIGHKENLDKTLVSAYTNTGVIHILAISGMHLGMIYGLMVFLLKPFRQFKWIRFLKPISILFVLWLFSLLASAAPAILRASLMFSWLVLGEWLNEKSNSLNSLAGAAFCLLFYQPQLFWDIGFQLSYVAVLSILLFYQPIYKWLFFTNPMLRLTWQINALTLSAQILTTPLILYYFKQFPNLVLLTNLVAVPLSGLILYLAIILLVFAQWQPVNIYIGRCLEWLIQLLNHWILSCNRIPFAISKGIEISTLECLLLYGLIACLVFYLRKKMQRRCP